MTARPLALLAALVAVALVGSSCDNPSTGKAGAPPGTVIEAGGAAQGTPLSIQTPEGRIDFSVSDPRHDLPAYDENFDHAADGASLVGVTWNWDFQSGLAVARNSNDERVTPHLSLVADGRSYSLAEATLRTDDAQRDPDTPPLKFSGTAWVSVEGEPDDLAVSVDYDGETQVVAVEFPQTFPPDVDDAVRPLYQPGSVGNRVLSSGACQPPRVTRHFSIDSQLATCTATVTSTPYQQDVGWAPTNDGWRVVSIRASAGATVLWKGAGGATSVYSLDHGSISATLDGRQPVASVTGGTEFPVILVFPAGEVGHVSTLVVTGAYGADSYGSTPGAPVDPAITVEWRTPIG